MESDSLYRRLQRHLDRMPVPFPATRSGVELRILEQLFTPDEATIALELSAAPEPASVIHRRIPALPLAELIEKLDAMDAKGLILRFGRGERSRYGKLPFAVGIYERQLQRLTARLERDTRQYFQEAYAEASFHAGKTTQMRIVPVNRSIPVERGVATCDDLRKHVEASPGPFAKTTCICRHGKDLLGEKCSQTDLRDNCLSIGVAAKWVAAEGGGTPISREEMLRKLDEADEQGLVLQPQNTQNPIFVCCCCGCCCGVLTSARRFERPAEYFNSNFHVRVNVDTCDGCGACQFRCQMDAIALADGRAKVELDRCIGCALCVTSCPSGSLHLEPKPETKVPPDDTRVLYLRMLRERYGPFGTARLALRKALTLKI